MNYVDIKAFVMQLVGLTVRFFWAKFPEQYIKTLRLQPIEELKKEPLITLCHTEAHHLSIPTERDQFIQEFLAIVRCIAAGKVNVGLVRSGPDSAMHHRD